MPCLLQWVGSVTLVAFVCGQTVRIFRWRNLHNLAQIQRTHAGACQLSIEQNAGTNLEVLQRQAGGGVGGA